MQGHEWEHGQGEMSDPEKRLSKYVCDLQLGHLGVVVGALHACVTGRIREAGHGTRSDVLKGTQQASGTATWPPLGSHP
jgi:hypothetical protein